MENNAVIKNGVGNISQAELVSIKQQMNHKALVRRRTKTALRLAANVMVGAVILLPLLYAISIAFMPSNELYTLDMNLLPKKPTFQRCIQECTASSIHRKLISCGEFDYSRTDHHMFTGSVCVLFP